MLGFGRTGELDTAMMRRMADETKGKFYHAVNERSLLEIFENLSIQLHDDGIDEISLRRLAQETAGQYHPVKNIRDLDIILEKVAQAIQHKDYEITFPSLLQKRDGTRRLVTLKLVRRSGELVSNIAEGRIQFGEQVVQEKETSYQTHGLVLAEMHPLVYLLLLTGLGVLLALPSAAKLRVGDRRG
jgi:hypothetical protein